MPGQQPSDYHALKANFTEKLAGAKNLEEVNQFAAALKAVTEAERIEVDTDIQLRNTKLEKLKSWSTIVVPIVAILSLTGTIWVQIEQSAVTRIAAEDAQWNTTLTALTQDQRPQAGYTGIERIKPFLRNPRYAPEARDLSVLLLGKTVDPEIFLDLLPSVFPNDSEVNNTKDTVDLARISRSLYLNWKGIQQILDGRASKQDVLSPDQMGEPPESDSALMNHQDDIVTEIRAVNSMLADRLRDRKDIAPIDLSGILFIDTDLHSANLQNANLDSTSFQFADLTGADLRNVDQSQFSMVRWWLAAHIDKDLLVYEMDNEYPYQFNENGNNQNGSIGYDIAPTRDEYRNNLFRLAQDDGLGSKLVQVHFGPSSPTQSHPPKPPKSSP